MKEIKLLAAAIIEQQKYGQISPQTMEGLEKLSGDLTYEQEDYLLEEGLEIDKEKKAV